MTSNLIAAGVLLGIVALALRATRVVARGGPWVARLASRLRAVEDSEFARAFHPALRFKVEERKKQAIIRADQAQGAPPQRIDLDAGTVSIPRPLSSDHERRT